MARECNNELRVNVRRVISPLLEPTPAMPDEMNMSMTSHQMIQASTRQAAIAAAVAATVNADDGDLEICFCVGDGPMMELIRSPCCQRTNHRQCIVAYLGINTCCPYCRFVLDISKVMELPVIDRTLFFQPTTPEMTSSKKQRCELEAMGLVVDESPTPLHGSDRVRCEAREQKRLAQQKQAKKMMKTHKKDLKEQGAGVGAMVVVSVDTCAVSHPMGIVGIIYQMKDTRGA